MKKTHKIGMSIQAIFEKNQIHKHLLLFLK